MNLIIKNSGGEWLHFLWVRDLRQLEKNIHKKFFSKLSSWYMEDVKVLIFDRARLSIAHYDIKIDHFMLGW